ncbi:porin [Bacteroidia bacterium]|nr:porin [Bacteroidia bacterium]
MQKKDMNILNNTKILFFIGILFPHFIFAQSEKENALNFNASYTGDIAGNFHGGIQTGSAFLGKANLTMNFDTEKAGWWQGGEFFINGMNTHGDEPTATLIGDFQTASNIDAGNHTALYELWYKQTIGKVRLTIGLQDLNADYAVSENGGLFNNSYFGIHSVCSDNIPVPIFPLTGLGVNVHWKITGDYHFQTVIFDGNPGDFEQNPYNVKWQLNAEDGFLSVSEFHAKKSWIKNRSGAYKIGGYFHNSKETGKNYGFYLVADQEINDRLSLFTQIGFSPKKLNNHDQCYGLGLNYKPFLEKRPDDLLGFAANHAIFRNNPAGNESVFELIYHFQVNENVYLRPDIQYIINPAGTGKKLPNALVGILRFGIEF